MGNYRKPFTFYSEEDSAIIADTNATLQDYVKQSLSQFVTGGLDIEKDWDQYLKNLEGMQDKELVAIYQKYV